MPSLDLAELGKLRLRKLTFLGLYTGQSWPWLAQACQGQYIPNSDNCWLFQASLGLLAQPRPVNQTGLTISDLVSYQSYLTAFFPFLANFGLWCHKECYRSLFLLCLSDNNLITSKDQEFEIMLKSSYVQRIVTTLCHLHLFIFSYWCLGVHSCTSHNTFLHCG